jgi:cytochrome c peroxidase
MRRGSRIMGILVCVVAVCNAWIGRQPAFRTHPVPFVVPKGWPQPVYDFRQNPLTQEGIALGKKLFYDGRLSKDGNFPCASCHQQFAAFANFDHNLSHGYNYTFTTRNAPSLQNLAWQKELMYDGGINHLDLQPLAPLTAHNEMAETISNVLGKLRADPDYRRLFRAAFRDGTINTRHMNQALSQFLLCMVSSNSKYDRIMAGKDSFNLPERLGYSIFKAKCTTCHTEPLFTDYSYRNTGMPMDDYLKDEGRMHITRLSSDSLKFKVPSLRNVAVTAPYGHDGRFFSLLNVFLHYSRGVVKSGTTDSLLIRNGLPLSNYEIGQLTAFLYTLTDSSFLKDPRFAPTIQELPPVVHPH